MTTYEEWRVTGTDSEGQQIKGAWYPGLSDDPEAEARTFVNFERTQDWTDGPHLHKRTVTATDWEDA